MVLKNGIRLQDIDVDLYEAEAHKYRKMFYTVGAKHILNYIPNQSLMLE